MTLYLKWYQRYDRSNLKSQNLLNKSWFLNFDLLYFWYPLRYRVIQYLIWKLLDVVKMGQEGLVVAALLISFKASWKFKIYYINRALSKLNCYALYLPLVNKYSKSKMTKELDWKQNEVFCRCKTRRDLDK